MEKREPSYTVDGNINWSSHYGEKYRVSIKKKTKNRTIIWSSDLTSGHISGQNYNSKRYTYPTFHSSTIYKSQDMEAKYSPTDELKKIWYIHIHTHTHTHTHTHKMEYYSAIKHNGMSLAASWLALELIILSEVSQKKTNIIWYHLVLNFKKLTQMNLLTKQI